jgi:hypothetical protein
MSPKRLALVAAMMAGAGCTLNRSDMRKDPAATILGRLGTSGQVIEPKRCALKVVILPRPLRDKAVEQAVWASADEQTIAPEVRRVLQANGLRVGIITGGLPAEVEGAINAPPPNKVAPAEFNLPDGANTLVTLNEPTAVASLLWSRDGHVFGKDYKDASGWFRVTANHDGPTGVALRIVPEIHHGPVLHRYDALPNNAGALNSMQFMLKDGQQEETLRELAASLTLQPGQAAVIGCDPDRRGSLGSFLFTQPENNSDRLIQKVVIIWASRTNLGEPGSQPKPPDRLVPVDAPDLSGPITRDKGVGPKGKKDIDLRS